MISYVNEIEALFDEFETNQLTEQEILIKCLDLIKEHESNKDFMYELNDTLNYRGYSFQFVVSNSTKAFDQEEYSSLIKDVAKSCSKTQRLIEYLTQVQDYRLTLASLHVLKIKYLIELGLLPLDNEILNQVKDYNYRDVLFTSYSNDNLFNIVYPMLEKIGIPHATLEYMNFRLDMEMLLWTIEEKDPNKGYLKVNAIKVALNIAPKEFFVRHGKTYYADTTSLKIKSYLKLIDKDTIALAKKVWKKDIETIDDTGYKALFLLL